jgi:hypothetical protein
MFAAASSRCTQNLDSLQLLQVLSPSGCQSLRAGDHRAENAAVTGIEMIGDGDTQKACPSKARTESLEYSVLVFQRNSNPLCTTFEAPFQTLKNVFCSRTASKRKKNRVEEFC